MDEGILNRQLWPGQEFDHHCVGSQLKIRAVNLVQQAAAQTPSAAFSPFMSCCRLTPLGVLAPLFSIFSSWSGMSLQESLTVLLEICNTLIASVSVHQGVLHHQARSSWIWTTQGSITRRAELSARLQLIAKHSRGAILNTVWLLGANAACKRQCCRC